MKKGSGLKSFIIILVMILIVAGYYYYLSNKSKPKTETTTLTEVDNVLLRDMDTNYPPSPKEVVKYYAAITKCFYDGNYSDEQLEQLANRARSLYDDELKATQTEEKYLEDLKFDIDSYQKKELTISSYSTSSSVDVEYKTTEQGELASLYCLFNMREGKTMLNSNQVFLLRKDEEGHWKILGWTLVKEKGNHEESDE